MVEVLVKELYSKKNRYISTVIPLCDKLVPVYYDIFRPPLSKKKKKARKGPGEAYVVGRLGDIGESSGSRHCAG